MFSPGAVSNRAPARSGPPRKHLLASLGPSSACSNAWSRKEFPGWSCRRSVRSSLAGGRAAGRSAARHPAPRPRAAENAVPSAARLPHDPQLLGNLLLRLTDCQPQDDLRPLHRSRRNRAAAGATLEFVLLWLGQLHLGGGWHGVRDGDGTLAPLHHTVPYSRANVQRNLSLDWNWTPQAIFSTAHPGSKSAPLAAVCMVQNF